MEPEKIHMIIIGASSGLGFELVKKCAEEGYVVLPLLGEKTV